MGWCRPSCETAHTSGFFDPIVIVPRRWGGVCDEEHRLVVTKKEWGAGQFEKAISDGKWDPPLRTKRARMGHRVATEVRRYSGFFSGLCFRANPCALVFSLRGVGWRNSRCAPGFCNPPAWA